MSSEESNRLAEFSQAVRQSSLKRLAKIELVHVNWRPKLSSMSFADIVYHLIETDKWLFNKLKEPTLKSITGSSGVINISTQDEYSQLLSDLQQTGTQRELLLKSLTDEDYKKLLYDDRFGKEVSIWWIIVRGNLDHEIHHRGQIVAYLKLAEIS